MLFSSRIRRPAVASATRSPASVRQTRLLRAPDGSRYKMPSTSSLRRAELTVCLLRPVLSQTARSDAGEPSSHRA